jgi:hypothetical protein
MDGPLLRRNVGGRGRLRVLKNTAKLRQIIIYAKSSTNSRCYENTPVPDRLNETAVQAETLLHTMVL